MNRVQQLSAQLTGVQSNSLSLHHPTAATNASGTDFHAVSNDDVVICCAIRTPLCKGSRGMFKDCLPEDILIPLFSAIVEKTGVPAKAIQDVCIGNVLQSGAGGLSSRCAQLISGIPDTTPLYTVNRQCSSGLQAVANIAASIHSGYIDIGIGGGVESMSAFNMAKVLKPSQISPKIFEHEGAANCLIPMGITSENVAEKFHITRAMQDQMAVESHSKAARAAEFCLYDEEIVPITVTVEKDNKKQAILVSKDEGIRKGTSMETLKKLKPSFKEEGSTHAGNSSQITDGAALCLLARRSVAARMGLPILAKFVAYTTVGVPPEIMGIGPSVAIPKVLAEAGMKMEDIDIFEINEAFASQCVYCVEKLGIPRHKLNPKGGAIALGHPLGATGARQIATLLPELRRTGKRYGVVSMCMGTGMGAAAIIENLM